MIVDLIRQVADWLADPSTGVNAQLASLPDDVGDATPPAVTVVDSTRDAWVARGVVPREKVGAGPVLMVMLDGSAPVPLSTQNGHATPTIAVRYVARKAATDELLTEALQTLRAAGRVLALRFTSVMGSITRNRTDLEPPLEATLVPELEELEGDELVAYRLTIPIPATDAWGLAAVAS